MNLFDIYEIPNHEIFSSAGYRRMNERDTFAAAILEKRRTKAHTIYRQHQVHDLELNARARLDADWITVSRFDSTVDADAIAAALSGQADEWRREGVVTVRFGSRTTDHPVYTTTRPHFMVLLEWQSRPSAGAMLIERVMQKLAAKSTISRQITFEGHRSLPGRTTDVQINGRTIFKCATSVTVMALIEVTELRSLLFCNIVPAERAPG